MSFKNALKKSIKSKTLFEEFGGAIIWKTRWANKYMSTVNAMYKISTKIEKKYSKYIGTRELGSTDCEEKSNTIWFCWLQGIDTAPDLVKSCYASIQHHCKDKEIILLNKENIFEYTDLPDYIIDKWQRGIISNTHFSDILRVNILIRHGGLWLDATTYLTGPLPDYIESHNLFTYRNGWFNEDMINMGSWLIYSKPDNHILKEVQSLLFIYWEKQDYLKNYFLLHIFFRMVTDKFPDEWNAVPYYNQIDQHVLQQELSNKFNEKRFDQIKQLSPIHKLTNKADVDEFDDNSYYSMLSTLYK